MMTDFLYWLIPTVCVVLLGVVLIGIIICVCLLCSCSLLCCCCCCCYKCCLVPYRRIEPQNAPSRLKFITIFYGILMKYLPIQVNQKLSQKSDPKSGEEVNVEIVHIEASKGYRMQINIYSSSKDGINSKVEEINEEDSILGGEVTNSTNDRKLILYFHMGGFIFGSSNELDHICKDLIKKSPNWIILCPNYRKSPQHNLEDIFEDGISSLEYLINNFAPEKDQEIVIIGESAGGHLSAIIAHKLRDRKYDLYPKHLLHHILIYPHLTDYISDVALDEETLISRRKYKYGLILNQEIDLAMGKILKWGQNALSYSVFANMEDLPTFYVISADYDYVKSDASYYIQKLEEQDENDGASGRIYYTNIEDEIHGFMGDISIHKDSWKRVTGLIHISVRRRFGNME